MSGHDGARERNIALRVEYDGTRYAGFQRQRRSQRSIQAELEDAIEAMSGAACRVAAAGRTDAGVHARGQVVAFRTRLRLAVDRIPYALNARLPDDIVVQEAWEVGPEFHPRRDARSKVYRYTIHNGPFVSPFWRLYAYRWPHPLDLGRMRQGAQALVGKHDFRAFRASGSSVRTTVRTLLRCEVEAEPPLIHVTAEGDGFLYNMVRIIAGTLLEVGAGRRDLAAIHRALQSGRREDAGRTLPAHGLCLMEVRF